MDLDTGFLLALVAALACGGTLGFVICSTLVSAGLGRVAAELAHQTQQELERANERIELTQKGRELLEAAERAPGELPEASPIPAYAPGGASSAAFRRVEQRRRDDLFGPAEASASSAPPASCTFCARTREQLKALLRPFRGS